MKYSEAWELAKENRDPNKKLKRLQEIFNPDSQSNKELELFNEICNQNSPDLDLELAKLGFIKVMIIQLPDYFSESFIDIYKNHNDELIELTHRFGLHLYFNNHEKFINYSDEIGKVEKQALSWIRKKINEAVNE